MNLQVASHAGMLLERMAHALVALRSPGLRRGKGLVQRQCKSNSSLHNASTLASISWTEPRALQIRCHAQPCHSQPPENRW
jgi:hypothetical protein